MSQISGNNLDLASKQGYPPSTSSMTKSRKTAEKSLKMLDEKCRFGVQKVPKQGIVEIKNLWQ